MRCVVAAFALSLAAGCASSPETSEAQAWAKCDAIADRAVRSSCITKALADAKADERAAEKAEREAYEKSTQAAETEAAVQQAMGVPEDETRTTIIREPLD